MSMQPYFRVDVNTIVRRGTHLTDDGIIGMELIGSPLTAYLLSPQ